MTFGGVAIGTFTGGTGTTALVVTLNAAATPSAAQALVRNVTYRNVSDAPSTAARTARFVLSDGDGGTSAPATRAIAMTAANDPPALAAIEPGALGYTENGAPTRDHLDADRQRSRQHEPHERHGADHRQLSVRAQTCSQRRRSSE